MTKFALCMVASGPRFSHFYRRRDLASSVLLPFLLPRVNIAECGRVIRWINYSERSEEYFNQGLQCKTFKFWVSKGWSSGDKTHDSAQVVGTYGYAAFEYVMTGH